MDRPGTRSGGTATGAPTRAPIPTAAGCSPRPRTSRCTSPAAPTTTPASSATGKTTISLSFELGRYGIFVQFCDLRVLRIAFSICCTEKHDFESAFHFLKLSMILISSPTGALRTRPSSGYTWSPTAYAG